LYCTSSKELCFNGAPINKNTNYDINNKLLPMYIEYIEKIACLYKTSGSMTTKSLEFICNREIDEIEFNEFIIILKTVGFSSMNGGKIQFIDMAADNKTIFNYNFTDRWPIIRRRHPPIHNVESKKHKSRYSNIVFYKRI
jgi:hypothetical protein